MKNDVNDERKQDWREEPNKSQKKAPAKIVEGEKANRQLELIPIKV